VSSQDSVLAVVPGRTQVPQVLLHGSVRLVLFLLVQMLLRRVVVLGRLDPRQRRPTQSLLVLLAQPQARVILFYQADRQRLLLLVRDLTVRVRLAVQAFTVSVGLPRQVDLRQVTRVQVTGQADRVL
jgi:hypothetical protein